MKSKEIIFTIVLCGLMRFTLQQQICASSNKHQYQRSIQDSNEHTREKVAVQWTEQKR
jgi:hypothetical protein